MSNKPTILWFRKDLRFADNSALAAAIEAGGPVIPVFIWAPEEAGNWAPGAVSRWWLHQALKCLSTQWKEVGGTLILRQGESLSVLRDLVESSGAERVYWNRRYESPLREIDSNIKRELRSDGINVKSFNSTLLNEPHTVSTGSSEPYKVYTPYWKKVKDRKVDDPIEPDLRSLGFPESFPRSEPLDALGLLPKVQWYRKLHQYWEVGEVAALRRLDAFMDGPVDDYADDRDRPDHQGTSQLSPYLHWGHIGPRQVVAKLRSTHDLRANGPQVYRQEIYWREFAYHVLYHFPETPDEPLQAKYAHFPWRADAQSLEAWQMGGTGYPIVDAGMRQLYETGWMHNRVRMIVSSLLVKHLLQDWHEGAKWFWDTLVDADLASNTLGWQWSGGCGADAAPYFRIFNPITQGRKFDPNGEYVRRFVPELEKIPAQCIHEPWQAPESVLAAAGVELGKTYPKPIIDHKEGRERALAAFNKLAR